MFFYTLGLHFINLKNKLESTKERNTIILYRDYDLFNNENPLSFLPIFRTVV